MLVDTYRCMNKGWLPRKGSFVVGKWGSSFVWCGYKHETKSEVAHCMCFLLLPCTFFSSSFD